MSSFRTALGAEFSLERRLPSLGWRPRVRRDTADGSWIDVPDVGGDDLGVLAIIGLVIAVIVAAIVLVPLLLFVAEVALVIALVIPLTIVALLVGIKQHAVVLTRLSDGVVVDQRQAHGLLGSLRAARALRSAAHAGAYGR